MELNQDNYENYLLLYIDNELTATEKVAVEAYLASNPKYIKELEALENTKLHPTNTVYPDKNLLYRFEEMEAQLDPSFKKSLYKQTNSTAKIIEFKKRYIAYASIAAVALWMLIGTSEIFNKTESVLSTTKGKPMIMAQEHTESKIDKIEEPNYTTKTKALPKKSLSQNKIIAENLLADNGSSVITNTNIPVSSPIPETPSSIVETATIASVSQENNSSLVTEAKMEKERFEEINTEDNDRVIYISNIELDGDKFRGVTRRISALFKRNKNEKNK